MIARRGARGLPPSSLPVRRLPSSRWSGLGSGGGRACRPRVTPPCVTVTAHSQSPPFCSRSVVVSRLFWSYFCILQNVINYIVRFVDVEEQSAGLRQMEVGARSSRSSEAATSRRSPEQLTHSHVIPKTSSNVLTVGTIELGA
jgi:hypothetical protein